MQQGERAGLRPAEQQRKVFGRALLEVCRNNPRVVVLDGDLGNSTGTHDVRKAFPDRFFNIGIAESNLVSVGAGMAACGCIPFITSLSSFLLCNAFDQIRVSVSIAGLNAKFVGSHSGLSTGREGPSSMSIEDFALAGALPPFVIMVPCDSFSMHKAVHAAASHVGPVYMRSSREALPHVYSETDCPFQIGKANVVRQGSDVTIIACGIMVAVSLDATVLLSHSGVSARVLDMHTVKPIDEKAILAAARETGALVTAEEHLLHGGMGAQVARLVAQHHPAPVQCIGIENTYSVSGTPFELMEKYGLTAEAIADAARAVVAAKKRRPC